MVLYSSVNFLNFTVMKIFLVESDIFDVRALRMGLEEEIRGAVYSFFKPEEMMMYMDMQPDIIIYDKEFELSSKTDFRKDVVQECLKKNLPVNFKVISMVAGLEEEIHSIYEVEGVAVPTIKLPITKDINQLLIDTVKSLKAL